MGLSWTSYRAKSTEEIVTGIKQRNRRIRRRNPEIYRRMLQLHWLHFGRMELVYRSYRTMGRHGSCLSHHGSKLHGICDVGFLSNLGEVIYLRMKACFVVFLETLDSDFQF